MFGVDMGPPLRAHLLTQLGQLGRGEPAPGDRLLASHFLAPGCTIGLDRIAQIVELLRVRLNLDPMVLRRRRTKTQGSKQKWQSTNR